MMYTFPFAKQIDNSLTGWWFQLFFMFTPKIGGGNDPIWLQKYFSNGLVQPPTNLWTPNLSSFDFGWNMYKRLQRFLKFHLPPTLTSFFKMHILSCELVTGAPMEDVLEAMQGMTQKSNLCFGAFWGPHILSLIFDDNGFPILSRMGCSTCRWLCMFLFFFSGKKIARRIESQQIRCQKSCFPSNETHQQSRHNFGHCHGPVAAKISAADFVGGS